MPRRVAECPLGSEERETLRGVELDLQEVASFLRLCGNSDSNVRHVLKSLEPLASGEGCAHRDKAGRFYAGGPDAIGTTLALDQDLFVLRNRANAWLPISGPGKLDRSNGWAFNHPLTKLIAFQRHKFGLVAPRRAGNGEEPPSAGPSSSGTPIRPTAKKRKPDSLPESLDTGAPAALSDPRPTISDGEHIRELQRELAIACAEPPALHGLPLEAARALRRKMLERLQRISKHVDELEAEASRCKICLDAAKSVIFVPCGHCVCCPACAAQLSCCPVCQSAYAFLQPVYEA